VQVVVNYVAMTPEGRVFENSLEKQPFDIRVGAGQVLPGLDEGLLSMKVRSRRRGGEGTLSLVAVHTCWVWMYACNEHKVTAAHSSVGRQGGRLAGV
jgi:hypothetical protein